MSDLEEPGVRVISAEPERIRVSVFGGRTQLDIALALDLPVSSFIPDLAGLVRSRDVAVDQDPRVKEERRSFWVLSRFDTGVEIRPDETLREAGVVNGELLRLSSNRALSPPTLYDDVVDAAARLNKAAYAAWDPRSARWMAFLGVNLSAFALTLLLLQPMSTVQRAVMIGLALVVVVGLTTFAAVAHRSFALDDVAATLGAATVPVCAALIIVPLTRFGGFGFAGACAALMATYYVCYRAIGTGHWAFLAAVLAAGLCGTAVLIHTVGVRADVVGVVTAILTVLLCGAVPRLTVRLEPFETPVAAADVERSANWSLDNPFPATQSPQPAAAAVNSGTNMPTAEQVWARVRSVSLTRSALLLGFAVTAVAANTTLLRDDRVLRWPVFTFTLTCAVVLGLRSRYFRLWWERAALVAPATTLGITACVLSQTGQFPLPLTAVIALLATAVTAVMIGLTARPTVGPNTRRTRALDYLDYVTVGALIPVALWVLGVYELLGPWSW